MSIHCMFPPFPPQHHGPIQLPPGFENGPFFGPRNDNGELGARGFGGPRGGHHHHHGGLRGRGGPSRGRHHGFESHETENPLANACEGPFGPWSGHHPRSRHPHRGRGGRGGRGAMRAPFGFDFLERFAAEMDNAQGPSLNRHERETSGDGQADFVPRADVFDTPTQYVIHVSLPGVQKSDVSLDYDSDKSTLHLSGVIHRPEFSEELHEAMIINERYSEVGVFERSIHLGTRFAPVNVDHENMSAKFIDGVLVVRLPKISAESEQSQKKIAVEQDVDTTEENDTKMEKDIETNESDAKHASVSEVPDETESMHVDTETEPGDLLTEAENRSYTPSHDSEEEDLYESIRDEFPKVH